MSSKKTGFVTQKDLKHLNVGDVQIGDGMLFVKHNETINLEDTLTYKSKKWRIVSEIEDELVQGDEIYLGFIIRKND